MLGPEIYIYIMGYKDIIDVYIYKDIIDVYIMGWFAGLFRELKLKIVPIAHRVKDLRKNVLSI